MDSNSVDMGNLSITLQRGQGFEVAGVTVTVTKTSRGKTRLRIMAPKDVKVTRQMVAAGVEVGVCERCDGTGATYTANGTLRRCTACDGSGREETT